MHQMDIFYFGDPSVAFKIGQPPEKPDTPTGETSIQPGETYTYLSSTTDPDGNQVSYLWDWGDGTFSEWLGPYNSGVEIEGSHSWNEKGTYAVRVKAKDSEGFEGEWSDSLSISLSRSRYLYPNFLERFPRLSALLDILF